MKRRHVLALSLTSAVAGFAEYGGGVGECGMLLGGNMHKVSVYATRIEPSADRAPHLEPIAYADLPADERAVVDESVETGGYEECHPGSAALRSFVARVERRRSAQRRAYDGETPPDFLDTVFLRRHERIYSLYVVVEDVVVSAAYYG